MSSLGAYKNMTKKPFTSSLSRILSWVFILNTSFFFMEAHADTHAFLENELKAPNYEIGDSVEGNYLAGYVAGLRKDVRASAVYFQDVLLNQQKKIKSKNPADKALMADLRGRAFLSTLASGDMDEAFDIARAIVSFKDKDANIAGFALTVQNIKKKNFKSARRFLDKGVKASKGDLASILLMAWTYVDSKDVKRIEQILGLIEERSPFAVLRDYHMGLIQGKMGNTNEAVQYLQKAYKVDPNALRIVDAYGRALSQQGNKTAALEVYEGFERKIHNNPIVLNAIKILKEDKTLPFYVQDSSEGAAEVLYALGSVDRQKGGEILSILYLRLAHYLSPQDPLISMTLADVFRRSDQMDLAITELMQIPKNSPLKPEAEMDIAYFLSSKKEDDKAVEYLLTLIKKYPDNTQILMVLGDIYRSTENWPEAVKVYNKIVDQTPNPTMRDWLLFFNRGTVYERNNQWGLAEKDLQKALELVPSNHSLGRAGILNYLGYSWVDRRENIDQAFSMLQEAVSLSPKDGAIIDSLGWAYYRLGRYNEAVRELEKAVMLKPSDAVLNDHLGDAYWKVGRKNEARFQWQHSLDSEPDEKDAKKTKLKLEKGLEQAMLEFEKENTNK